MLARMKQNNLGAKLLLMVFTAAIFLPMLMVWRDKSDFVPHIHYVERMLAGEPGIFNEVPNFLWHSLVIGVHVIVPSMPLDLAGVAASLWLYCLLALILFALIRPLVQRSS